MKKKILVTASTFPRWINDTEPKFIYDLCKEYTQYYEVTVLVPRAPESLELENMEGIKVIRYGYFPIRKWETLAYPGAIVPRIKEKKIRALLIPFLFLGMYRAVKKEYKKADFIHCNWIIPQGIIQRYFDKPYILTGLGGDVTSLNKGIVKKMKKKAIEKAAFVTVVSKDLKNYLDFNFNTKDIKVIPMGVDLEKFSPKNRQVKYFKNTDKPIILFVGRLAEKKGTKYLIQAMKKIDATLIIVGDGPEKRSLETLSKSINADIRFVGAKTKEELTIINASSDVFCAPSIIATDGDKDGLPVAIIEAMASGIPIVASDVGGIKEAVDDSENGFLVAQKDVEALVNAINQLLVHPNLRLKMGKAAREKAKVYNFSNIAEQYKKLFDNLLE